MYGYLPNTRRILQQYLQSRLCRCSNSKTPPITKAKSRKRPGKPAKILSQTRLEPRDQNAQNAKDAL